MCIFPMLHQQKAVKLRIIMYCLLATPRADGRRHCLNHNTHMDTLCVFIMVVSLSLLPWLCCDKWQLNQSSWLAGVSEIIALAPGQFQANSSCSSSLPSLLSCDSIRLDSPSPQLLAQPAGSSDPLLTPLFSAWTCATSNSYTDDMLCVPPCSSVAHIPLCFQLTEAFEGGCICRPQQSHTPVLNACKTSFFFFFFLV